MSTPIIKLVDRTSLITFKSSLEDFDFLAQNDGTKEVNFSHFALLNLPDIRVSVDKSNSVDFDRIEGKSIANQNSGVGAVKDKKDLSESLQNYMMNFESLLVDSDDYVKDKLHTPTESIFWKWLKEVGGIRYRKDSRGKVLEENKNESDSLPLYKKVVQYVGAIGIENTSITNRNSFKEVYILVPTESGSTPKVQFKSIQTENYLPNMLVSRRDNKEYILGQTEGDELETGIGIQAHYDKDVTGIDYNSEDSDGNAIDNWLTNIAAENVYITDELFNDVTNEDIVRVNEDSSEKEIYRSKLDGVRLDLDFENYEDFSGRVNSFEDYNKTIEAKSFQYNVCLLYYTVKDTTTLEERTNLYGVAFLGNVESTTSGISYVDRTRKIKNDGFLSIQGNSKSYKFNFKIGARQGASDTTIETEVNPETHFAMGLFSEVYSKQRELLGIFEKNSLGLKSNYEELLLEEKVNKLTSEVEDLAKAIADNGNGVNSNLYQDIYSRLQEILTGNTTIRVENNFQVRNGANAGLKYENGILRLIDKKTNYSQVERITLDSDNESSFTTSIGTGKKMLLLRKTDGSTNTVRILLDDTANWELGQSVIIKADPDFDKNVNVEIYTDKNSRFQDDVYGFLVKGFLLQENTSIELTCINDNELEFIV